MDGAALASLSDTLKIHTSLLDMTLGTIGDHTAAINELQKDRTALKKRLAKLEDQLEELWLAPGMPGALTDWRLSEAEDVQKIEGVYLAAVAAAAVVSCLLVAIWLA